MTEVPIERALPIMLEDLPQIDWPLLSFLHVGSGDGSLCKAASRAGARSVVGIQLKPAAGTPEDRPRDPVAAVVKSISELSNRRFDMIVLSWTEQPARLSQPALLACLGRLTGQGTLFVDMFGSTEPEWAWSRRDVGGILWEAPSRLLLEGELFRDTAFRLLREEPGPTPGWRRYLVRAQHWRQDIILTSGMPASGKTSLVRTLSGHGLATYSLDQFLQYVACGAISDTSEFAPFVRERFQSTHIHQLVASIQEPAVVDGCAELLAQVLPIEPRLLVTEGFLLSNGSVLESLRGTLRRQGRRCWSLSRLGDPASDD